MFTPITVEESQFILDQKCSLQTRSMAFVLMSSGTERPHLASIQKARQAALPLLLAIFTLAHSHSMELILALLQRGWDQEASWQMSKQNKTSALLSFLMYLPYSLLKPRILNLTEGYKGLELLQFSLQQLSYSPFPGLSPG